jgi:MYXO-CTERM domain-containing protein
MMCEAGECVNDPDSGNSGEGGAAGDNGGGGGTLNLGGQTSTSATRGSGATTDGAGGTSGQGLGDPKQVVEPSGCGCRTAPTKSGSFAWLLPLALLVGRRRSTRAS